MTTVDDLIALLESLQKLLMDEQQLLLLTDSELTADLAQRKLQLLSQIDELHRRSEATPAQFTDQSTDKHRLRNLARNCKRLNAENQVVLQQRLKLVRHSLDVLRDSQPGASLKLYDRFGGTERPSLRRKLALA